MRLRSSFVHLSLLLTVAPLGAVAGEPILLTRVEPIYPRSRIALPLDGHASVIFDVNEQGRVVNAKLDDATEVDFGEAAIAAVRQWRFKPAEENGKNVVCRGMTEELDIPPPVGLKLNAFLGRPAYVEIKEPVVDRDTVTTLPVVVRRRTLTIPQGLGKEASQARVRISFVIDARGLPVNPKIESSSDERFDFEALLAVTDTFWTAGSVDGRAANVRWEETMDFGTAHELPALKSHQNSELAATSGSGNTRPVLLIHVEPPYPFEMKRKGAEGRVVVGFRVTKRGDVADVYIASSTNKGFDNAAMLAVSHWKFFPAFKDGAPVSCRMMNPIGFRLAPAN